MFLIAIAVILVLTALAKIWSAFGQTAVLYEIDPIFGISFRTLMLVAASLELIVAGVCLYRSELVAAVAVVWLSLAILIYRIGLWWVGWEKPCHCLGDFSTALGMSSEHADSLMKGVLALMLFGGGGLLLRSRNSPMGSNSQAPAEVDRV